MKEEKEAWVRERCEAMFREHGINTTTAYRAVDKFIKGLGYTEELQSIAHECLNDSLKCVYCGKHVAKANRVKFLFPLSWVDVGPKRNGWFVSHKRCLEDSMDPSGYRIA